MAAEWQFKNRAERQGARRVCGRVYEELDDLIEELGTGADKVLYLLEERLTKILPFDQKDC